jgi:predicted dehydrogenase
MSRLRVGLVGCGHMGRFHAAKLAEISEIDFVGCYDIDMEKAEDMSSKYKNKFFSAIDQILKEVDAVCIAVPTQSHSPVAEKFLNAGKAVLLEKPIAESIESAEKLVQMAEKNDAVLQIGHSERFNPAFLAVEKGISNPRFIETHRLAPYKGRGDDVAVILDLMIHDLDLIMALTHSIPDQIDAAGVAVITNTIDIANARLKFPGGCVANVTASRISVKEMRKLRVFQKSGYTSVDMASREAEQYVVASEGEFDFDNAPPFGKMNLPDGRAIVRRSVKIPPGDNLKFEISSFIGAARREHPPAISGRDGLNALKVAAEIENLCKQYLAKM